MVGEDTVKLGKFCLKIGSGATPRGGKDAYKGGATSLIRSQNIYNDGFHRNGIVYIDDSQAAELRNVEVKSDDVLLNITGDSVARCCQVADDVLPARVNQHVAIIRPQPNSLNAKFLRYILVSHDYQSQLLALASAGATRPALTKTMIEELDIPLPPLPEQRAIAHILGTLDCKIELNRRMNETLEAMARAFFKSWFVDFDPVRAKMEGRWKKGKSLPGLPAHLYDLFPARLVDSELGEIPEGWEVKTIGDIAEVIGGSTPSTKEPTFWENGIHHWATPKDLSSLTFPVLLDTERRVNDAGLAQISSGLLPVGTVLLSSRAPIGYLVIAEVPVAINQGFIAMKSKSGISNLFIMLWTRASHEEILSRANGSTFLEISKSNFRPIKLSVPLSPVMDAFDESVRPLYNRLVSNERETRVLAVLRDTLLPKLISGELRVPDAEKFVGRAI